MISLKTSYLGLELENPLIASSSGLTNSVEKVLELEKAGIGAVVLKSLFEEQINMNAGNAMDQSQDYPEAYDYVKNYVRSENLESYLKLVRECSEQTSIPVIASINCYSGGEWVDFAKRIEEAGADALELNVFIMNASLKDDSSFDDKHYEIVRKVKKVVSIPVSVKISYYFNNIVKVVDRLKGEGAEGVVLFNRFYQPDINIDKLELTASDIFSVPSDLHNTLRWVAITSGQTDHIDISASTGVHDWDSVIKLILAGAQTVQVCSALYKNGNGIVSQMTTALEEWMNQKGFNTLKDFRGKLNYSNSEDPAFYERVQFMKYYSSHK
ncbi:dihydroorotate dehydrogenase-like protein [Saccharicrinis sp. FJH62]|uniref:dihydroorotate dehydrogenase-like protein n=1 Tax=Saccharicrinis sp. FJH62 TaxID=3344657 RepID=UPI0035D46849